LASSQAEKTMNSINPLHEAVLEGDLKKVKALLKRTPDLVFSKDESGMTPLHPAARRGDKDVAELLLANHAAVNAKNIDGQTPLHWAALNGHKDLVQLLLANKADVNAKNNDGFTPLHPAARRGDKDVAELLLANQADVNAKTKNGVTPLHWAAEEGHKDVAELLLANDADVNAKTKNGVTPLHYAARWGDKDVAELLLANHADVNAKDDEGQTPLHYAEANGHMALATRLRQHGVGERINFADQMKKAEGEKRLKGFQAALAYLDDCGELTSDKLRELATFVGHEIDEERLREMWELIEREMSTPEDPRGRTALRASIREQLLESIRVTDSLEKGIPDEVFQEHRSVLTEEPSSSSQTRDTPVLLYKYFSATRLNDVIGNKEVRFSQPSACNDPFDVLPTILFNASSDTRAKLRARLEADANQALQLLNIPEGDPKGLRNSFLSELDEEVEGHITMLNLHLKQEQERLKSHFDSTIGIFCLSERNDSILMWSHYADAHCGFAVGFCTNCSFFSSVTLAPNERLRRVSYTENRPTFTPDGPQPPDPVFVKSAEWAYEKEWRVVRQLADTKKVVQVKSSPFPIYLFTLPQEAFDSVIFGCRAPSALQEECRRLLEKDRKMSHVRLLEAFPSHDRFLLEVRQRNWKDNVKIHAFQF
jgi:ankyrin repeat protein